MILKDTRLGDMRYEDTDYNQEDFLILCGMLDDYLSNAIGGKEKREKYDQYNRLDTMDYVIIAYDGNKAVGCSALRQYDEDTMELKRVFVKEEYRGRGIAGEILLRLITNAKNHGYKSIILETGEFLQKAYHLYRNNGFIVISNYGYYVDMKESLCMELKL